MDQPRYSMDFRAVGEYRTTPENSYIAGVIYRRAAYPQAQAERDAEQTLRAQAEAERDAEQMLRAQAEAERDAEQMLRVHKQKPNGMRCANRLSGA
jgi:membrane protein involved in colicin uptake